MSRSKYRTLVELELFQTHAQKLGIKFNGLDEALQLVTWAVSKNPTAFDEVPGLENCYIAKTDSWVTSDMRIVPALRLFFRVQDDDTVLLCAISVID